MKKIVSKCVICKVIQENTLLPPSTTKPPDYRTYFEFPFENVGHDYVGPLYTRDIYSSNKETYINSIVLFLFVQQHIILILNWYQQNCPRVNY